MKLGGAREVASDAIRGLISIREVEAAWHGSTIASLLVEGNSSVHVSDNALTAVVSNTEVVTGQHLAAVASFFIEIGYLSKILRNALAISIPVPIPVSEV
tara:strand:+ start:2618 stop:2917 length:300 start_codon:yes stop_codon:yes gene_type:complete